jgi:putative N6-adenine-specific DNA methylase
LSKETCNFTLDFEKIFQLANCYAIENDRIVTMKFIAKTMQGLENVLAEELQQIGAQNITPVYRGVQFEGDMKTMYRANLELRTALRILAPIASYRTRKEIHLYNDIQRINWDEYMDVDSTFAIDATVVKSDYFKHSKYVALKCKDAVVDQFREKYGRRPNVETTRPDFRIHIYINDDTCDVLLDSSGESLHRRGLNREALEAPLNEVLAAGLVLLSGWKGEKDLIDPMCGSGTILIEAAMIAKNIPPLLKRKYFAFLFWKNFDKTLWEEVLSEANARIKPNLDCQIIGYDKNIQAVRTAQRNASVAGIKEIKVDRMSFETQSPPENSSVIITNPPYDERLQIEDTFAFYATIGDVLKQQFKGSEAWIITGNLEATKHIGLRTSRRFEMNNGGIACKFLKFEMYDGSKKAKFNEQV